MNTLQENPFFLLGATTRDDKRRIIDIVDDKALELDHDICQKARSDLTNPRARLGVEMSWLPGVSPKKAVQLMSQLDQNPMSIRMESGLPSLAHANLMAAAFKSVDINTDSEDLSVFIIEMANIVDEISIDEVTRDINEDRLISGFSEINGFEQVEDELIERKRYFKDVIKSALDCLGSQTLIEVMTLAVDESTSCGEYHAPELIDDLVDSYEVETLDFLQQEAENVYKLIKKIRDHAPSGETAVKPLIEKLEIVTTNWDKVAQPIQLNAKARGFEHKLSNDIAYTIRSLAIELFNEYDMLAQTQRITHLLQELFAELPEVVECLEQDTDLLQDIYQSRKQAELNKSEWAKEITYTAEIGIFFKDTLSISPDGVSWKNKRYPLNSITKVRWGGISQSVNGISTGTIYTIAFGDSKTITDLSLKKREIYSSFIDKLWRGVCVRILTELLESLKAGNEIRFGDAVINDSGITLVKKKFWGSNETINCNWQQVIIWSSDGCFFIGLKSDRNVYVKLSYISTDNVHILEQAISLAFKKVGIIKLSEILEYS